MSDMTEAPADRLDDLAASGAGRDKSGRYSVFAGLLLTIAATTGIWALRSSGSAWSTIPLLAAVVYGAALWLVRKAWLAQAETQKQRNLRLLALCALIASLLSAALLLIFSEARHLDNTLDGMNLFRLYFFLSAGIGAMLGARLARLLAVKKIFVIKAFLISCALFSITGASQLNRLAGMADETRIEAEVLKMDSAERGLTTLLSGEPARYVYIQHEEDVERLTLPKLLWNTVILRDTARLTVRKGYLGYPYVIRFNDHPLQ